MGSPFCKKTGYNRSYQGRGPPVSVPVGWSGMDTMRRYPGVEVVLRGDQSLTDLEQILLLAALRLGEDAVGADIQAEVETHAHREVSIGSIHVTLSRLEGRGFVRSGQTEPRAVRGGKSRRATV